MKEFEDDMFEDEMIDDERMDQFPARKCNNGKNGGEIIESTNNVIGWIGSVGNAIQKYGLKGTLTTILVIFIAVFMTSIVINPEVLLERIKKIEEKEHKEEVEERLNLDPKVQEYLKELRNEIDCDRVFIFETHNGGTSLNGLPFLYVDMAYEETRRGIRPLEQEYQNLRLSRYPFTTKIYNDNYWFGSINEIREYDPALYYRLTSDEDNYIGFLVLYGKNYPSGCLGITYSDTVMFDDAFINKTMMKYGARITPMLSNYNRE